ncbi:MAG: flagellar hook-associated protein FlgK [Gemmatimonadales bacterium]|nr:flagellar hook-associated protein FlgK [Gemmatimonadales bacterium]
MPPVSLAAILSTARGALLAQQKGVTVAAHNIANANTEGFSRQRVVMKPEVPLRTPDGYLGRGVIAPAPERVRDLFLDENFRAQSGQLGGFSQTRDALRQIEGAVNELGDAGIGEGIDQFFSAWGDLANLPTSGAARTQVLGAAAELSRRFRNAADALAETGRSVQERMDAAVRRMNTLTVEIRDLNRQIQLVSSTGSAPDLEDARDRALDELSRLANVRVSRYQDGSVGVVLGGVMVADAVVARQFTLRTEGAGFGVGLVGETGTLPIRAGELEALGRFTQATLPGLEARLDTLVAAVVDEVNTRHAAGQTGPGGTTPGETGVFFFDSSPAGRTARGLALSSAVQANPGDIVTGAGTAGDAGIALAISRLRTARLAIGGGAPLTFGEYHASFVTDLGVQAQAADRSVSAFQTLVEQVDNQRASVKDVSIDEEMVALVRYQQAYAAAARIVTTADEMMDAVLQMVR